MKKETGPIPDNHVIGVLKTRDEAGIKAKLEQAGFEDVQFLTKGGVDQKVDPKAERANPVSRLIYYFVNHLSEQDEYLEQYEEAARRGNHVIAVRVEDEKAAEQVNELLQKHGVVDLRFFGKLAVKDLTPNTNPSASSDRLP